MGGLHQCSATAGNNALLGSSLRVTHGILDAVLALLQLHLGGGTDLQDGHTAGELRQALLQLLAVVVGVSVLDLLADLLDATLQLLLGASTIDDGGVILGDNDLAGGTQQRQVSGLQVQADLLGDNLAAGQDRNILQLSLAAVAEARSLHGNGLEGAADLVHNEGGQCLALDVLSHDQQWLAGLHDLLQQWQQILNVGDLGAHQQDVRILQDSLAALNVGGEVAGDVALIEAHTLGDGEVHAESVGLLDGDHAVLVQLAVADLVHGLGDQLADLLIRSGDAGGGGDLLLGLDLLGVSQQVLGHLRDTSLDAALDAHRVGAGSHVTQALADQGLSQNGSGGRAVTGDVVGLLRDLLDQFRTDLLVRILQLDLASDGHTVVGDRRCAPLALEDYVATLRTQGDLDGISQGVQTGLKTAAGLFIECNHLRH